MRRPSGIEARWPQLRYGLQGDSSRRNIHVPAAASPRFASTCILRPLRHRDSSPRNLHVPAAASPACQRRRCPIQQDLTRIHAGESDYLIYAYCGKEIVKRLAFGSGGLTALKDKLEPENVNYALVSYEHTALAKRLGRAVPQDVLVFVTWFPPGMSPMVRGAVSSHRAAVQSIFAPFQLDLTAETLSDLDNVDAKVVEYVEKTF